MFKSYFCLGIRLFLHSHVIIILQKIHALLSLVMVKHLFVKEEATITYVNAMMDIGQSHTRIPRNVLVCVVFKWEEGYVFLVETENSHHFFRANDFHVNREFTGLSESPSMKNVGIILFLYQLDILGCYFLGQINYL